LETILFPETPVNFYDTRRRNIIEGFHLQGNEYPGSINGWEFID
jgi:hypothetical protein